MTVDQSDGAQVGRAFVAACKTLLEVGRKGMKDPAAQTAFRSAEATVMAVADREAVRDTWGRWWGRLNDRQIDKKIDSVIKNWPSIIAHYVETADPQSGELQPRSPSDLQFGVTAAAEQVFRVGGVASGEMEALGGIRQAAASQRDAQGTTLAERPAGLQRESTWQAVNRGISPDPTATLLIGMRKRNERWWVVCVSTAPGRPSAEPIARAAATGKP